MQKNTVKKILCVASILTVAMFTAGCDDDNNNNRHARHHQPAPSPHHRPNHDYDKDRRHNPPPRDDRRRPSDVEKHRHPDRDCRANMVGEYKATALNNAVTFKGASYYIDISEDNDELYLTLPNGYEYPISFDNGQMSVAGGSITEQSGGQFVYKDKKGGIWLVEKTNTP